MNGNAELLNYIHQNAQMGETAIERLTNVVTDENMLNHLHAQLEEYTRINERAETLLNEGGHEKKDISGLEKLTAQTSIGMQTLRDKSPSHIAEMMIQGSTMGIIDATKNLKKYEEVDPGIHELMDWLLHIEQSNIDELKGFLG